MIVALAVAPLQVLTDGRHPFRPAKMKPKNTGTSWATTHSKDRRCRVKGEVIRQDLFSLYLWMFLHPRLAQDDDIRYLPFLSATAEARDKVSARPLYPRHLQLLRYVHRDVIYPTSYYHMVLVVLVR